MISARQEIAVHALMQELVEGPGPQGMASLEL